MHHAWLHHVIDWMHVIQAAGPIGWGLFIALYAACCLLFVPGSILTLTAGVVYGFWGGCLLVLIGNGLGSVCCLLVTRLFLRDWVSQKIVEHPRLKAVSTAMAHDDCKLVFLTRLSPVMPFSLINYSLGVTAISPWRFLLATEMGALPVTLIYVYMGTMMGNLARIAPELKQHRPIEWMVQGAGLVIAIGVTIYVTRLATRALNQRLDARPA